MKKIISLAFALVLVATVLLSVPFSCLAAVDFVQSITYKPNPEIVIIDEEDGRFIIGYVRDQNGNIIGIEYLDCIVVTPVSGAEKSDKIPDDAKKSLLDEYKKLTDPNYKLSDVEGLDDKIKKETDGKYGADDMVIRDLFDISMICDDAEKLNEEGNYIDLKFNLGIGKNEYITAMVFVNGKWTPIKKLVNNGDGTVTGTFESLGHVAFLVPSDAPSGNMSPTGDTSIQNNLFLWIAVMVVAAVVFVVMFFVLRKKRT